MFARGILFGLLAFHVLWLLVVLPGHTRGQISWTRTDDARAAEVCCGPRHFPPPGQESCEPKQDEPNDEQRRNCAVCAYALGLTPPPVFEFDLPDLGLLELLPLPAPIVLAEQEHLLTYYACGPPVV